MSDRVAIFRLTSIQHFAKDKHYYAFVETKARLALARNIKRLRKALNWSQERLSQKSGVGQTTISYVENPEREPSPSPSLEILENLANAFGVEVWQLMLAELPEDLLTSKSIEKVVQCFIEAGDEGRANITRIAEAEVRYSRQETQPTIKRQ